MNGTRPVLSGKGERREQLRECWGGVERWLGWRDVGKACHPGSAVSGKRGRGRQLSGSPASISVCELCPLGCASTRDTHFLDSTTGGHPSAHGHRLPVICLMHTLEGSSGLLCPRPHAGGEPLGGTRKLTAGCSGWLRVKVSPAHTDFRAGALATPHCALEHMHLTTGISLEAPGQLAALGSGHFGRKVLDPAAIRILVTCHFNKVPG